MIVGANSLNWFENVVCLRQYLFGQSPAGTEKKEQGRSLFHYPLLHLRKSHPTVSASRRSCYQSRSFSSFLLNRFNRIIQGIAESDERKSILARFIVDTAVAVLPVVKDLFRQSLQGAHWRDDKVAFHPIGASRTGDIMDVHVGNRGRHHLMILVVNRVVNECEVNVGHTFSNELRIDPFFHSRANSAEGRRPSTGPEKRSAPRAAQRLGGAVASRGRPSARSLRGRPCP